MYRIIAALVFVLAVVGMVGCAVRLRRARFRTISGRIEGTHTNIR